MKNQITAAALIEAAHARRKMAIVHADTLKACRDIPEAGADGLAHLHFDDAGVPILAGTDTANPGTAFGAALHGELELLVKAGMTPLEALRSATSVPAGVFGLRGMGRIAPGGRADLVLVQGDPSADIAATRRISAVWKDGVRIDRAAYLRSVKDAPKTRERQKTAPAPDGLGDGLISDFEGDRISARFGAGWMPSTDSIMGGKSKAELSLASGGAAGSPRALLIKGEIAEAGSIRWAAALFSPGQAPMTPADLSSKKALSFRAKGEGKTFAVMVYAQSSGFVPKVLVFTAGRNGRSTSFPSRHSASKAMTSWASRSAPRRLPGPSP